ncbi:SAM-dependent methyltransferase, partial [Nocardia sp. NPDC058497]
MPGVKDRLLTTIADQLGNPHGMLGKGVAFVLNRGNKRAIAAAVDAAAPSSGATVADIGFGGGVGLTLLLDRVGPDGVVHGVEPSPDMLARARSGFATEVGAGGPRRGPGARGARPPPPPGRGAAGTPKTQK